MKTKTIVLLVTAALSVGCVVFLSIIDDHRKNPAWEQLVSETHRRIKILKEKPYNNLLRDADVYIDGLNLNKGFSEKHLSTVKPTVVIPAWHGVLNDVKDIIGSAQRWLEDYNLVIFDIGLSSKEQKQLITECNRTSCQVRSFGDYWKQFPSHVKNLHLSAFRPLIIQLELNRSGAVLYMSPSYRFVPDAQSVLKSLLPQARRTGFVGWPQNDSTSAVTHPRLFSYLYTSADKYYFHRTVLGDYFLVYYTENVHNKLMMPWMQCSLTFDCISPIGALEQGCQTRVYRRPRYLYTGCHQFDLSALNTVLGRAYDFTADSYLTRLRLFKTKEKYR